MTHSSTVLVLALAVAGCSNDATRTENSHTVAPAIGAHERSVTSADFGGEWPFTVERGILSCVDGSSVVFTTSSVTYALNGHARGRLAEKSWREAESITKTTQLMGVASVERLEESKRREIFRAYIECEETNASRDESDRCKRRLQTTYSVSAQELSTIGTEGLSHSWPPLKPIYVSLEPMITAGLALCRK